MGNIKKSLNEELSRMKSLAGLIKEEHSIDAPPADAAEDTSHIDIWWDNIHPIDHIGLARKYFPEKHYSAIGKDDIAYIFQQEMHKESENKLELPQNKKTINSKLISKEGIKKAIYKILEMEKVEGRYHDDNWEGIAKFRTALEEVGAEVDLVGSGYKGHGTVPNHESMPTKKVYVFDIKVRDKRGNVITFPFQVTCAFVGKTGTMSDDVYELTYYSMS